MYERLEKVKELVESDFLLKEIIRIANLKDVDLYLVGGYIRDKLIKSSSISRDYDFIVSKGEEYLAKVIAERIGGHYVLLDAKEGINRVVYKNITIDISRLKGKDIFEDLTKRDFTINAIAINLNNFIIYDPYRGIKDIENRIIKPVKEEFFLEDSLRMLRALRFKATFSFSISPKINNIIKKYAHLINNVSAERIVNELFIILETGQSHKIIKLMHKLGLLFAIFPEMKDMENILQDKYYKLTILSHVFRTLKEYERIINDLDEELFAKVVPDDELVANRIKDYLEESIHPARKRKTVLKLVCLFHDIGKPMTYKEYKDKNQIKISFYNHADEGEKITQAICNRLKLSKNETLLLRRLVKHHMRAGYLASCSYISDKALFRLISQLSSECIGLFLISLADFYSTPYFKNKTKIFQEKIKEMFNRFNKHTTLLGVLRPITGDDIVKTFKISPGPIIGKLLYKVEEEVALGNITNRQEALDFIKRILSN